ncbi:MAG TPA: glycoside hydrolase family 16 protein [Fimbriimonadaceae bacterium]|nr:glycoside hydrolase family 16 protein [Fimbriimonadaceae bacterium]
MLLPCLLGVALGLQSNPLIGSRKLVWSDEFDGKGGIDAAKWNYDLGPVYNNEKEKYSDDLHNVHRAGGYLVITADDKTGRILSGRLTSKPAWLYGYYEVRAKFPTGRGTWPAIWFLGDSLRHEGSPGWPRCGEIDLMENVGFNTDDIHFSVHTGDAKGRGEASKTTHITVPSAASEFHTYGLVWEPDHMDFYCDGKKTLTYTKDPANPNSWPFDKPEYMILNLAIGGDWGGAKGIDPAIFPSKFYVDYVRVYQ